MRNAGILNNNTYTFLFLFLYTLLLFFGCSRFSPLYNFNYWADVNIYFNIGKGIWNNEVIYRDLFDHKGPLIFFIYSIGYLISNASFVGMFVVQILFQSIALYFAYLTIRLFVKPGIALLVSLLAPLFLLVYSAEGGSAEEFIYLFEVISFYFILKYLKKGEAEHPVSFMIVHGIMFSLVFFIKLNLVIFWFFPLLILFITLLYNKRYKNFFYNILGFLLGVLTVLLPLLLYFYCNDALSDFWNAYFRFNFLYGELKISSIWDFVLGLIVLSIREMLAHYLIYTFIILGIILFTFSHAVKSKAGKLSIILSALSSLAVMFSTRVLLSYYLIPFMLFSILGCIVLGRFLEHISNLRLGICHYLVCCLLCLLIGVGIKDFFGFSIKQLYNRDFPQTEVEVFGPELLKSDNPDLLIAGFKKGIPLYTKWNIQPKVKYFFFPNIEHEVFPAIRNEQTRYIREKLVEYVVLYKTFRYYDYYKDILEKNYVIQNEFEDAIGGVTYLYKKK